MSKHAVFIDGSEGTTGLEIQQRLESREDIELIKIDSELRKDLSERARLIQEADAAILCLPDVAAREVVAAVGASSTKIIDASTAHRVDSEWVYGLPELCAEQRERLAETTRIANPGCHSTSYPLLLRPLVDAGILPVDAQITATSLTGYSGGGKNMIARFESETGDHLAACPYALGMQHKHLPEMQAFSGLESAPAFLPTVGRFFRGMILSIPLHASQLKGYLGDPKQIVEILSKRYADEPCIQVFPANDMSTAPQGLLDPTTCNHTNRVDLLVHATGPDYVLLQGRLDNLVKGASGAAVQNLNIALGAPELSGLTTQL
ncbi:MAG: N-acetyl-gamma-glutamyl-phosphate reductase [Opitutales bacterium]|nr:N-acetyl-gamma-glutamyl-phosphate reductase [Opitutales bacterium]NRA27229.1 N-acetyl-gamma-glutamyl-phosphate reductase [Opitutales bacterium]